MREAVLISLKKVVGIEKQKHWGGSSSCSSKPFSPNLELRQGLDVTYIPLWTLCRWEKKYDYAPNITIPILVVTTVLYIFQPMNGSHLECSTPSQIDTPFPNASGINEVSDDNICLSSSGSLLW
ncbi:hypothetical protein AVEN_88963-1 [Araneus ventricosus]|uniref:Uncharacterized protein n=1 Tax=Araneus ventricosus TaxID=182803 RepID=A0A4Y2DKB5_ARAVE|nr:hypothetical protein AVEN_88963-1 [Araneus ventricosus]